MSSSPWKNKRSLAAALEQDGCLNVARALRSLAEEQGTPAESLEVQITKVPAADWPPLKIWLPLKAEARARLGLDASSNWYWHVTTELDAAIFDVLTGPEGTGTHAYLSAHFDYTDSLRLVRYDLEDGEPSHAARHLLGRHA